MKQMTKDIYMTITNFTTIESNFKHLTDIKSVQFEEINREGSYIQT